MGKRFLVFFLVLAVASAAFAAGSGESKGKTVVTIWHSAQGANANVFDSIAEDFNSTIGREKGIEIESIYQGKANDVLTKVNAAT